MRLIIDSTQIDEYFNSTRRDAQELLPHLIRKLVFATLDSKSLVTCRIPVGDDIGRPGYDGRIEAVEGNSFVPIGVSVWEMGTSDPSSKAEKDYNKRTENPGDINPAVTSFIFVTPHKWTKKDSWIQKKLKQGVWKDVRVLDNIELETWLETAPAISRWFARQIGIPLDSFKDIDLFLDELCAQYGGIKIPNDLIIGGRDDSLSKLSNWIGSNSKEVFIKGESIEEAAIFIAATIRKLPKEQAQQISAQTLFIEQQEAIDFLASCLSPHVMVPLNNDVYKRAKVLKLQKVRLIVPLTTLGGHLTKGGNNVIELGPFHRRPCCEILKNMGISSNVADRISSESKGSFGALFLLLGGWRGEALPWMIGEGAFELIPLMLAGQWSIDNKNDHNVIEKLSEKKYSEVEQTIAKWKAPTGPLVRRDRIWDWLAWDFAWEHLASQVERTQIERFTKVAKEILTIPDPRFELAADERWMSSIRGKVHPYSGALRSGLIGSTVQVAIHSDIVLNGSGQVIADSLVRSLLIGQDDAFPIDVWLSVSSWLPDLAEASPDVFLEACENLMKNEVLIGEVFEEVNAIFPSSEHTHLLRALERLAWPTKYLSRVTLILGELSSLDPGGKLGNRPINSLTEIFLPWHPQTEANVQQRIDAIDILYQNKSDIAWSLAVSLLPEFSRSAMGTNKPKWRNWKIEDSSNINLNEYWTFIRELVTRMITWAGTSGQRWLSLIESYNSLRQQYPDLGNNLLSAITQLNPQVFSESDRNMLSEKFRDTSTRHRQLADADWAMKEEDLLVFDELYSKFIPTDVVQQYSWLFDSWPEVPISSKIGYEEREEYIKKMRLEALNAIYKAKGLDGLSLLAQTAQSPYDVGLFAAKIDINKSDVTHFLKHCLSTSIGDSEQAHYLQAGQGLVMGRYKRDGIKWVEDIISQNNIEWDENKYVNLALGLPANTQTWDLMKKWGENIPKAYWKNVGTHSISPYDSSTEYAITQILNVGRPYAALNLASFSIRSAKRKKDTTALPQELIVTLLEEAPKHDPIEEKDVPFRSLSFDISELLDILEDKGVETSKLVQLEWVWMSALEHSKRGFKALQGAINNDPNLFIDILKLVYRCKNEEPKEYSDQEKARAEQAYKLLRQWKTVPGLIEQHIEKEKHDGDISFSVGRVGSEKLFGWIDKARCLAEECGRIKICDIKLGNVLAYSPSDPKGNWPCEAVCDSIEKLASIDLEHGIEVGVHNKRGAHFRAKGGEQERKLASKFQGYAKHVRSKWPRTAAMLDRIADSYEREGRRYDERDDFEEFE